MLIITKIGGQYSGKKFQFHEGEILDLGQGITNNQISIDFPSDSQTTQSTLSINLGTIEQATLQFKIFYTDIDRTVGTDTSATTYAQMIPYLKKKIFNREIGEVKFQIDVTTKYETLSSVYRFDSVDLNTNADIYPTGSIKLIKLYDVV